MDNRDYRIIWHTRKYCDKINKTLSRIGNDFEIFCDEDDDDRFQSISMSLLQIGELSIKLSEEFKNAYKQMPWGGIRKMRNIFAHRYDKLDKKIVWETVLNDIPALSSFCNEIIVKYEQNTEEVESPTIGKDEDI